MTQICQTESPLVGRTLQKKQQNKCARSSLAWGFINFTLAAIMYLEMCYGSILSYFNFIQPWPVVWYAECGLAVLFTFNTVVDMFCYLAPVLSSAAVELTPRQGRLLGICDSDQGFRLMTSRPQTSTSPVDPGLCISPASSYSGSHATSFTSTSTPVSALRFSPGPGSSPTPSPGSLSYSSLSYGHSTPSPGPTLHGSAGHHSANYSGSHHTGHSSGLLSPNLSHSLSHHSHSNLGSSGLLGHSYTAGHTSSLSSSFNMSSTSPLGLSTLFREGGAESPNLRSRFQNVSCRTSPLQSDEMITDEKALAEYFAEERAKDLRAQQWAAETSPTGGPSFWNYGRTASDYTHILGKYQYQVACRSPQSIKSKDDDADDSVTYQADEVWRNIGVHREELEKWTENIRKWLSQTVMERVMKQIENINKALVRIGSEDRQIGEVGISTLKQLAVTKGQYVPNLNTVIPFLEVCADQEYLVQRIRELGSTGCMSDFRWNAGGDYKGKPWGEHLPTDSAILMHMLCTYMDCRLPPHPKYPDGKTFTNQHFLKTPDKPNLKKKDNLCIYQSRMNPPHFKVVIEDDVWNLSRGRNNIFHTILLFLHYIKHKQHGMLGHINLGLSGVNLLWVLDENK